MYGLSSCGIVQPDAKRMVADYFAEGFGYADYPNASDASYTSVDRYGISIISRDWIEPAIEPRAQGCAL